MTAGSHHTATPPSSGLSVAEIRAREQADAGRAIRFLLVKAAIFILVPLLAALIAVVLTLK